MKFEEMNPIEKLTYIIENYDNVIDMRAYMESRKTDVLYTKEELKSSMYFYILMRADLLKSSDNLKACLVNFCKQATIQHKIESSPIKYDYNLYVKRSRYEKENNCTLETKDEVCKALGIKGSTYDRHFKTFTSMDAKINDNDSSDRAESFNRFFKDSTVNVEEEVINKLVDEKAELKRTLDRCIDSLSKTEAYIIRSRYFNNTSYEKICKELGITNKSAKSLADSAKVKLRGMLVSSKNIEIVKKFINR